MGFPGLADFAMQSMQTIARFRPIAWIGFPGEVDRVCAGATGRWSGYLFDGRQGGVVAGSDVFLGKLHQMIPGVREWRGCCGLYRRQHDHPTQHDHQQTDQRLSKAAVVEDRIQLRVTTAHPHNAEPGLLQDQASA